MKRLSRNMAALMVSDLVRRLFGFISVAFLARVLGTSGFGVVNIGWMALAYGIALSAAGLPTLGAKRIAAGEDHTILPGILGSRVVISLFVFAVLVFASLVLIHDRVTGWVVAVMGMSVLAQSVWVDWYFQGRESLAPVAWARSISAAVYLAVILIFVRTPQDVVWVAGAAVMGDVLAADYMVRRLRRDGITFRLDVRLSTVWRHIRESLPLAVGGILAYLSINFPPFALGLFRTTTEVGLYGAASKLVFFLLLGDRILSTLLLPASARLHARSPLAMGETLSEAQRWIVLLGLPTAIGGTLLAGPMIRLVFGGGYEATVPVFQIFVWYFFVTMIHTVYTAGVIAAGGERTYGRIMTLTAVLYVVTVSIGTYRFGTIGAAAGVVLSEALSAAFLAGALHARTKLHLPRRLWGILLAAGCMGGVVYLLRELVLIVPIIAGVLIYVAVVAGSLTVSRDDWRMWRERL